MSPAGSINAWKCPECGQLTSAVHVDAGVTPMFLACRATDGCTGMAVSAGYPQTPHVPAHIIVSIRWEWRKASTTQMKRYRRENPGMYQHCLQGGLVLEPLSDDGRARLAIDEGITT